MFIYCQSNDKPDEMTTWSIFVFYFLYFRSNANKRIETEILDDNDDDDLGKINMSILCNEKKQQPENEKRKKAVLINKT